MTPADEGPIAFIARNVVEMRGELREHRAELTAHILQDADRERAAAVQSERMAGAIVALSLEDRKSADSRAAREKLAASLVSGLLVALVGFVFHKLVGWP